MRENIVRPYFPQMDQPKQARVPRPSKGKARTKKYRTLQAEPSRGKPLFLPTATADQPTKYHRKGRTAWTSCSTPARVHPTSAPLRRRGRAAGSRQQPLLLRKVCGGETGTRGRGQRVGPRLPCQAEGYGGAVGRLVAEESCENILHVWRSPGSRVVASHQLDDEGALATAHAAFEQRRETHEAPDWMQVPCVRLGHRLGDVDDERPRHKVQKVQASWIPLVARNETEHVHTAIVEVGHSAWERRRHP